MNLSNQLWNQLHDMFDTDDGTLPDIYIDNVSPQGVESMWAYLKASAGSYASDASVWHKAKNQEIPISSVINAAKLVVTGEAEVFHIVLHGIIFNNVRIPDLGVFVFPDAIHLDYRMGPEWGPNELQAFFGLLRSLYAIDENAVISLPGDYNSEWQRRFREAMSAYLKRPA